MTEALLAGAGVLVTRPLHLARDLTEAVVAAGGHAVAFPLMDILPRTPAEIDADRLALPDPDIVIFISRNAVHHGVATLRGPAVRIAAVGPATRQALEAAGRSVDIVAADGYDSEHLLETAALRNVDGLCIRIVRGADGRELLADTLRQRGATVDYLPVYRRVPHVFTESELGEVSRRWLAGDIRHVVVMSVQSLEFLLELLPADCLARLAAARLVTPSARVIKTALERVPGMRTLPAASPAAHDLVAAMIADRASDNGTGA